MENKISVTELGNVIKTAFSMKKPVLVLGPPGVGKSWVVRKVADELGVQFLDIRAILYDIGDIRMGVPDIENKRIEDIYASFLPKEGQGILFLDEFNLAPQMMQRLYYQLILDRAIGSYRLPDGWVVVAAGNDSESVPEVEELMGPLYDRFFFRVRVSVPSVEEWTEWAIRNEIDRRVISFLNNFVDKLYITSEDGVPLMTPRRWHFVSDLLKETDDKILLSSVLPQGIAQEFISFLEMTERVDIERVLRGEVPQDLDLQIAVLPALASYILEDKVKFEKVYEVVFPKLRKEAAVLLIRMTREKIKDCSTEIIEDIINKYYIKV